MKEDITWNGAFLIPDYVNLKIVPELVPSNLWGKAPRVFVGQSTWNKIRKYVQARAENKCEICGSDKRLEVHERYKIKGNYLILARLICVCKHCHSLIHPGYTLSQSKDPERDFYRIAKEMAEINGIEDIAMNHIMSYCFAVHADLGHVVNMDYSMLAEEEELANLLSPLKVQQALLSKCPE